LTNCFTTASVIGSIIIAADVLFAIHKAKKEVVDIIPRRSLYANNIYFLK
jgi:hypothetical protein